MPLLGGHPITKTLTSKLPQYAIKTLQLQNKYVLQKMRKKWIEFRDATRDMTSIKKVLFLHSAFVTYKAISNITRIIVIIYR